MKKMGHKSDFRFMSLFFGKKGEGENVTKKCGEGRLIFGENGGNAGKHVDKRRQGSYTERSRGRGALSEGVGGGITRRGREGKGVLSEKGIWGKGLDLRGIYAIICGERLSARRKIDGIYEKKTRT